MAKWFQTLPTKQKSKIVKDVTQLVLARRTRMCNFLEYKGMSIDPSFQYWTKDRRYPQGWQDGRERELGPAADDQIRKSYTDAMPLCSSSAQSHREIMN